MLVLSRKEGEGIQIGEDIRVVVFAVHRGKVRLGFEAPTEVQILRDEVRRRRSKDSPRHAAVGSA